MAQTETEIVQGIGTRRRLDGGAQKSQHGGAGSAGAVEEVSG
jgi:hypothetical protein